MVVFLIVWLHGGCGLGYATYAYDTGFDQLRVRTQEISYTLEGGKQVWGLAGVQVLRQRIETDTTESQTPYQFTFGIGFRKDSLATRMGFRYRAPYGDSLRDREVFVDVRQKSTGFLVAAWERRGMVGGVVRMDTKHAGHFGPVVLGVRWIAEFRNRRLREIRSTGSLLSFAPFLRMEKGHGAMELALLSPGWEGPVGLPVITSDGLFSNVFWGIRLRGSWRFP